MKIFIEEQKITQWWMMLLIVSLTLIGPIAIILDWESVMSDGNSGVLAIILGTILPILVLIMFFLLKLTTRIDEFGVHYKYFPFHFSYRTILWSDLMSCEIRKYRPLKEYGGWGIKTDIRRNRGKSFTLSGTIGLQMVLKTGKKILLGTQRKEDLQRCLNTYEHKLTNHGQ